MAKFLANENVPRQAVAAAKEAGHDIVAMADIQPGASDDRVMSTSLAEGRVLITFDHDFGELVYRRGGAASAGIILLRPRLPSPEYVANFVTKVLLQEVPWEGKFSVAREGHIRVRQLPNPSST